MLGIKTTIKRIIYKLKCMYRNSRPNKYRFKCACCFNRFESYNPIPDYYLEEPQKYGRIEKYVPEMLNEKEYTCPCCGASDRDRAYALYMIKEIEKEKQFRMLDIAPTAALRSFIVKMFSNVDYKSADLYKDNVDYKINVEDMSEIKDGSVDFFICSHVLEHVSDDVKAMKELKRILAPGGKGICVVPIEIGRMEIDEDPNCSDIGERWRRFGQDDHIRAYSKDGFLKRLETAGFAIKEYNKDFWTKTEMDENGLIDTSTVYIVS